MRKSLLLFCLLLFRTCFAQEVHDQYLHEEYLCKTTVSVSAPIHNISVVGGSSLLKTGRTASFSWMTLRNDTDSAITEYAMLLEVFDASHKRLYGIVFHDFFSKGPEPFYPPYKEVSAPFPLNPVNPINSAVEPGSTFKLMGMTPFISSRCPATASLSFVFLKFANGKTVTHASPGWSTDPAVVIPTDHLLLGDCAVPRGVAAPATIALDSKGNLQSFALHGPALPVTLTRCLRRELALWEFEPAMVEGKPIASQLSLVVLFDPNNSERWKRWENEYAREVAEGVSVLDLVPWDSKEKEWNFGFGSDCCFTATKFHP